jgi:phosphoribosylformylglycinamidine cyclo-ligase
MGRSNGWKSACDIAGVSWGGGETPTLKDIMIENTAEFGGSAVGIIKNKKYLLTDKKLSEGDAIILLKSNGINANGLSLARAIAKRLSKGYETIISGNTTFGEALLQKTNIYASLLEDLRNNDIDLHYASNITGHGLRKIMRGRGNFSYIIDQLYDTPELFSFMTRHAGISEEEAYGTWNMGQDYSLFLPKTDVKKALDIIKKSQFEGLLAGHIITGKRQVTLTQKNICFSSDALDLR